MPEIIKEPKMDMRPTFHVTDKELPAIKDWEVGEEYMVVLAGAELVSLSQDEMDGKKKWNAMFRVSQVKEMDDLSAEQVKRLVSKVKRG